MTEINAGMFKLEDYGMSRLGNDAENARHIVDKMLDAIEHEYAEYGICHDITGGSTSYQLIGHMITLAFSIMEDSNTIKDYAGRNLNWDFGILVRDAIYSVNSEELWECSIISVKNMMEACVEKMNFDAKANHYYTRIMIGLSELHGVFDMLMDFETDPRWDRNPISTDDSTGGCML